MFSWISQKATNASIIMTVKELEWEVEFLEKEPVGNINLARILAQANLLRTFCIDRDEDERFLMPQKKNFKKMIDNPFIFDRNELQPLFDIIFDIKMMQDKLASRNKKISKKHGIQVPHIIFDHDRMTSKAWQLWLATLGAGINPNIRHKTRKIWAVFFQNQSSLRDAIFILRETEAVISDFTGAPQGHMYGHIGDAEWLEWSRYVPSAFQP